MEQESHGADAPRDADEQLRDLRFETSQLNLSSQESPGTTSRPSKSKNESGLSEIQNIAHLASPPTVSTSRAAPLTNHLKRTDPFQFGSRYLEENDDVYAWNAWDHVDPSKDADFLSYAETQYAFQKENAVSEFDRNRFNSDPKKWWDKFYGNNQANFFKDRKWLRQEFPILVAATTASVDEAKSKILEIGGHGPASYAAVDCLAGGPWNTILEVGAGAGNTAFPLARENTNPNLMIHACDLSSKSIKLIQESPHMVPKHITASQWDMAGETIPEDLEPGSVDIVMMIFAFSALAPSEWSRAVQNIWDVLRPGGEVCFRDYGRGDLAQVRFKKGRLLEENFYVRGDGTRVYFFETEELKMIWRGEQKHNDEATTEETAAADSPEVRAEQSGSRAKFEVVTFATDNRLLVNRQKKLKMYRCWQQGRFRKPSTP